MLFERILIPVNGSEPSKAAVAFAISQARHDRAVFILVHVYAPLPMLVGGEAREELVQVVSAEEDEIMNPTRVLLREAGVDFRERLVEGDPVEGILSAARQENCDLILMGVRLRSSLGDRVLGSVSREVVREAPCPVLLVRYDS